MLQVIKSRLHGIAVHLCRRSPQVDMADEVGIVVAVPFVTLRDADGSIALLLLDRQYLMSRDVRNSYVDHRSWYVMLCHISIALLPPS